MIIIGSLCGGRGLFRTLVERNVFRAVIPFLSMDDVLALRSSYNLFTGQSYAREMHSQMRKLIFIVQLSPNPLGTVHDLPERLLELLREHREEQDGESDAIYDDAGDSVSLRRRHQARR